MTRAVALAVVLCMGTAAAQTPADAPVIEVQRANILSKTGEWTYPEGGVYLSPAAAENTASYIRELEADHISDQQILALVAGAVVLGFLGGVAAARLLPAQ